MKGMISFFRLEKEEIRKRCRCLLCNARIEKGDKAYGYSKTYKKICDIKCAENYNSLKFNTEAKNNLTCKR